MILSTSAIRSTLATLTIAIFAFSLVGCPKSDSSGSSSGGGKKLDGVYHGAPGSPITLTIKAGKATMTVGNESKTLDYKVEGNKLTILNPQEGNAVFTINDDGTLNSELGVLTKSPG
jgi:hypothetical protein